MLRFVFSFVFSSLFLLNQVAADDSNAPNYLFYGYLSHQVIFDSYRSLDSRDGELYFYPLRANFDPDGVDLNKKSRLNMVEVQSRFGVRFSQPDLFGAALSGTLEADFFGTHQDFVRLVRLRQAFVELRWPRHSLLLGNAFHPTFVLECFPNTLSFASGVPFHPLNRSPQVRYTYQPAANLNMSLSLLTHGYHRSAGPREAQKNSGLPDTQFRLQYGDGLIHSMGIVAGYKFLTPRDQTTAGYSTSETIGSYNVQAYIKRTFPGLILRTEALYGQNLTSFVMIGGYGIRGRQGEVDLMGDYSYTNIRTMSAWADLETPSAPFSAGLFLGYSANLGANHDYISLPGFNRNDDLHYIYRIGPRMQYQNRNLVFAFEWNVVGAVYGLEWDSRHRVTQSADPVVNNHVVFGTKYFF